MNYELAKQLKDSGFPQNLQIGNRFVTKNNIQYFCENYETKSLYEKDSAKIPTLSELIEACGDRFWKLEGSKGNWHAFYQNTIIPEAKLGQGSTPEEAVAKLWLEINQQNNE